jgi:hypothetical protein
MVPRPDRKTPSEIITLSVLHPSPYPVETRPLAYYLAANPGPASRPEVAVVGNG